MSHKKPNFCQDCGDSILKTGKIRPKRCGKCYNKYLRERGVEEHPLFNIELRTCKRCGGFKVPTKKSKLCKNCYDKEMSDRNRCKLCGGKVTRREYEICKKCSVGVNSGRWNHSLTPEFRKEGRSINPEYYKWRLKVYERDNFQCQKCGDKKGGNLVAHHIFSFKSHPELRTDISNGITFCDYCHRNFHRKYTNFNNNQIQLNEFLNIK